MRSVKKTATGGFFSESDTASRPDCAESNDIKSGCMGEGKKFEDIWTANTLFVHEMAFTAAMAKVFEYTLAMAGL